MTGNLPTQVNRRRYRGVGRDAGTKQLVGTDPKNGPNLGVEGGDVPLRRLREHLMVQRPDVQNIDLMILAGFCRNCLADWYREAAEQRGIAMTRDEAREAVYGMPFAEFKARHQAEATPEQLAAFEARKR